MATSSVLYAAAKEIGTTCETINRDFLKCKAADDEPSACLAQGDEAQACALAVLKTAMTSCEKSFQQYATCLDNQISQEYMFERCRKEEGAFVECRKEARGEVTAAAVKEEAEKR